MIIFVRGTTPEIRLKLPFGADVLSDIYIAFAQDGYSKVIKSTSDVKKTDQTLAVTLTQTETLKFKPGNVEVQIRAITVDGVAIASKIITADVGKVLQNGVIE